MRKAGLGLATVLLAVAVTIPVFGTESFLRKVDGSDKNFDAYLPPASFKVPWLNMDSRTKLPKGDYPIGRNAEVDPLIFQIPHVPHADMAEYAFGGG